MSGEKAAVQIALDAGAPDPMQVDEEQLELDDLLGLPETSAVISLREKRGRGRPPNARNRRTVEMVDFLLKRYASPLEVLAQIATARVDELSVTLGCKKLEALQEKRLAAIALIPYVHQKQPTAIDISNKSVVHLNITIEDASQPKDEEPETITLTGKIVEAIEHKPRPEGEGEE